MRQAPLKPGPHRRYVGALPIAVFIVLTAMLTLGDRASAADSNPGVATLKQLLEARLQSLKPDGMTERNVIFTEVQPGTAQSGKYPFRVSLIIRDYGPGYPANRYYGETCIGRIDKAVFDVMRGEFGDWKVDGPMTAPQRQCKPNPAAGVSSIPLSAISR